MKIPAALSISKRDADLRVCRIAGFQTPRMPGVLARHNPSLPVDSGTGSAAGLKNSATPRALRAFRRPEILVFLALTLLFSAPAICGSFSGSLIFQPAAVRDGEWWRMVTHPFVHATRYHLLLDGAAFVLLYHSLLEPRLAWRLAFVVAAGAGSLGFSWLAVPGIEASGLCGLSGIAHGLMAVSAVEMLHQPRSSPAWRIGLVSLAVVIGKAAIETLSGHALFGFLYFGQMGSPVAVSHAGGIVGSLSAMLFMEARQRVAKSGSGQGSKR